jgi:hypothetical protein
MERDRVERARIKALERDRKKAGVCCIGSAPAQLVPAIAQAVSMPICSSMQTLMYTVCYVSVWLCVLKGMKRFSSVPSCALLTPGLPSLLSC